MHVGTNDSFHTISFIFYYFLLNLCLDWINNDIIRISFKTLVKANIEGNDMNWDMIKEKIFVLENFQQI